MQTNFEFFDNALATLVDVDLEASDSTFNYYMHPRPGKPVVNLGIN